MTTVGKTQRNLSGEREQKGYIGGNVKERSLKKYQFTWEILSHVVRGAIRVFAQCSFISTVC